MLISSNTETPRAPPHISPAAAGQRPRNAGEIHFVSAESAIQLRTAPMPQSLSKVVIHVIFSTRDCYHGWTATPGLECTPTWRPSAATQRRKPSALAEWPIMSTS